MNKKELRQLIEATGLTQAQAAAQLGISLRHMQYQVAGKVETRTLLAMRWIANERKVIAALESGTPITQSIQDES